ncbi:MAG: terpene cyclase/mutase family protein [Verrucomicrobia bacterium]|nr:terpene cyclase/mutase family protein [Verrucomicrobiota bacterium]
MKSTAAILIASCVVAAAAPDSGRHISIEQELRQAIARGNAWLKAQQKPEGHWDDEGLPALTALALTAAVRDPNLDSKAPLPPHVEKGFTWLLAQQKEDGGIYNRGLSVYNTATSLTALMAANKTAYEPAAVKARKHLVGAQWDIGEKGKTDNPNDGGIGYGSKNDHTDLSNTYLAIEALALSKRLVEDGKYGDQPDLDWEAAIKFISRCQNLEETNDQEFASDDPKNKGGFVYTPDESKAGEDKTADGRTALRSYGSMSYAGLLSFIYAKVSADDPRVLAVKEWLAKNYTLEENPGMGTEGLYYYYQTMAKALTAANIDNLKLENGKEADWRDQLGRRLLTTQREDGSWVNSNGRWMESNPILVTAYTVLAMEQLCSSIPKPAGER